jgi:hypothetical protein
LGQKIHQSNNKKMTLTFQSETSDQYLQLPTFVYHKKCSITSAYLAKVFEAILLNSSGSDSAAFTNSALIFFSRSNFLLIEATYSAKDRNSSSLNERTYLNPSFCQGSDSSFFINSVAYLFQPPCISLARDY